MKELQKIDCMLLFASGDFSGPFGLDVGEKADVEVDENSEFEDGFGGGSLESGKIVSRGGKG